MTQRRLLLSLVTLCLVPACVWASSNDAPFSSIRQKAMGGAGVANTFDENALYVNPAGLSRATSTFKLPFRLKFQVNDDALSKLSSLSDLSHSKNKSNADISQKLKDITPLTLEGGIADSPLVAYVQRDFGIGAFADSHFFVKLKNSTLPSLSLSGFGDIAPIVGVSHRFVFSNIPVDIGVSGKYIFRARAYNKEDGSTDIEIPNFKLIEIAQGKDSPVSSFQESGFGADLGALIPVASGNIGVVIHNIATSLSGSRSISGNATAKDFSETLPFSATMGYAQTFNLSSTPYLGWLLGKFDGAIDYALISETDTGTFQRLHMGLEKKILWDTVHFRMGLNQGYPTFGLGIHLFVLHVQYAYFTEEKGQNIGDNPQTSHVAELCILF